MERHDHARCQSGSGDQRKRTGTDLTDLAPQLLPFDRGAKHIEYDGSGKPRKSPDVLEKAPHKCLCQLRSAARERVSAEFAPRSSLSKQGAANSAFAIQRDSMLAVSWHLISVLFD